jgi:hypothetical protein
VVVDLHPGDGVHVGDVPPRLQLLVLVDPLDDRSELAVAADRHADPHPLDGLRRSQPRLALGFLGDGLVDPLGGLLVDRHR